MSRSPGRPASHDKKTSRQDLLAMALNEFAAKGFSGMSIRKLAASAGVSDSLFVHHFGSKQKLWYEAVDTLIEREFQLLITQLGRDVTLENPLALLQGNIREFFLLAQKRPALFRLLFSELNHDSERSAYLKNKYLVPYVTIFDRAIDLCRERGQIKPIANVSLHALVLGALHILIKPDILQQGVAAPSLRPGSSIVVDDLVDTIFNGLTVTAQR